MCQQSFAEHSCLCVGFIGWKKALSCFVIHHRHEALILACQTWDVPTRLHTLAWMSALSQSVAPRELIAESHAGTRSRQHGYGRSVRWKERRWWRMWKTVWVESNQAPVRGTGGCRTWTQGWKWGPPFGRAWISPKWLKTLKPAGCI